MGERDGERQTERGIVGDKNELNSLSVAYNGPQNYWFKMANNMRGCEPGGRQQQRRNKLVITRCLISLLKSDCKARTAETTADELITASPSLSRCFTRLMKTHNFRLIDGVMRPFYGHDRPETL